MAGGDGCRGRRGRRLRDDLVVNSTLSPGLKLGHVGLLRGRTAGRVGPGLVLVRPGARASGSPLLPGWVPGVLPPSGGTARGRSAERRVWVAWPRRHLGPDDGMCPARGEVPPIRRGECREVPGLPPAEGAVRRAVPGGHERDGVRVGLLMPKAAGDSSSWTPGYARPCSAARVCMSS